MKKRIFTTILCAMMVGSVFAGCGAKTATQPAETTEEETEAVEEQEAEGVVAPSTDVFNSKESLKTINNSDCIEIYKQVALTSIDTGVADDVDSSEDLTNLLAQSTTYEQEQYYYTKLSLERDYEKSFDFMKSTVLPDEVKFEDVYGISFDELKASASNDEAFEKMLNSLGFSTVIVPNSLNEALFTDYGQVTFKLDDSPSLYKELLGNVDESKLINTTTEVTMEEKDGVYVPTEYFAAVYWMEGKIQYSRTMAIMISYTDTAKEQERVIYYPETGTTVDSKEGEVKEGEACGCGCGGTVEENAEDSSCSCGDESCTEDETSPCGPEHGCYTDDDGVMHCGDSCEGACCKDKNK